MKEWSIITCISMLAPLKAENKTGTYCVRIQRNLSETISTENQRVQYTNSDPRMVSTAAPT